MGLYDGGLGKLCGFVRAACPICTDMAAVKWTCVAASQDPEGVQALPGMVIWHSEFNTGIASMP